MFSLREFDYALVYAAWKCNAIGSVGGTSFDSQCMHRHIHLGKTEKTQCKDKSLSDHQGYKVMVHSGRNYTTMDLYFHWDTLFQWNN